MSELRSQNDIGIIEFLVSYDCEIRFVPDIESLRIMESGH